MRINADLQFASTGNHSAFNSPHKSPSRSSVAAFNSHFTTPRKPRPEVDDSSAGETPRSPEAADSDATPEIVHARSALTRFDFSSMPKLSAPTDQDRGSPSKEKERPSPQRRDSWLVRNVKKAFSPGRGEIHRPSHAGAVEKQVKRRREKNIQRQVARRRRMSASDTEDDGEVGHRKGSGSGGAGGNNNPDPTRPHWLRATFSFIAEHPTVPHILSFYAQLAFNLFLLGGCAYLIYCFWAAVQGDVDKKSHEAMADIMAEMAICARSYAENRCDPATRLPALETVCNNWYKCAHQDPARVGRAKVSAHTFAEIFNSFVEPISWKAMFFAFGLVFACFFTTNMAFGHFRDKASAATHGGAAGFGPYYGPGGGVPATPHRTFSGQDGGFYTANGAGTPWHQPAIGQEPQPSGGYGQIDGRGSPSKRLQWD